MQIRPKVATTTGGPGGLPEGTPPDGQGQDIDTAGSGILGGDPAAALVGAPSGAATDVMSTLLPAVLGGVAGAAGGPLWGAGGGGRCRGRPARRAERGRAEDPAGRQSAGGWAGSRRVLCDGCDAERRRRQ